MSSSPKTPLEEFTQAIQELDPDRANILSDDYRRLIVGEIISSTTPYWQQKQIDTQVILKELWGLRKLKPEQIREISPVLWDVIKLSVPLSFLLTLLNDSSLNFSLAYLGIFLVMILLWAIRQKQAWIYCTSKIDTLFIAVVIVAAGLYILAMFHGPHFQFFDNLGSSLVLGACLTLSDHYIDVLTSSPSAINDKPR